MTDDDAAGVGRRSLGAVLSVCAGVAAVLLVGAVVAGSLAIAGLDADRDELVRRYDPALLDAQQLRAALLDQETGVRGYALGGEPAFLEPWTRGRAQEDELVPHLRELLATSPDARADLEAVVDTARRWRAAYAEPVLAAGAARAPAPDPYLGKAAFDRLRAALQIQEDRLVALRGAAGDGVNTGTRMLQWVGIVIVLVLAGGLAAVLLWLRRVAIVPVQRLAAEVRQVAEGDLEQRPSVRGPKEITALSADVDAMRRRLLAELADVQTARRDLERSNADLEQFAYVASHDLQEPLRKVASFCQLLGRRYSGQLDERADQYIEFAVDGAKRMQVLINDLLAFSRVGRTGGEAEVVDAGALLDLAAQNVAGALEESGGVITRDELPRLAAEPALLTTVFQNLLGNAVKFRGPEPLHVHVGAERDDGRWLLRFSDNGIGIEPEYGERIFAIFQRLHGKADYPGTGIGLAMCRRIVEHHGGTIWFEPSDGPGSRFVVALPVLDEDRPDVTETEIEVARV